MEGIFFVEKLKSCCRSQFLLWWELLPNMPGIQSLKSLLLFVIRSNAVFRRNYTIINLVSSSLSTILEFNKLGFNDHSKPHLNVQLNTQLKKNKIKKIKINKK